MLSKVILDRTLRNAYRWNSIFPYLTLYEDAKLRVFSRTFNTTRYCFEDCRRDVYKQSPLAANKGFLTNVEPSCLKCSEASKLERKEELKTDEELKNRTEELKKRIEELEQKEEELEKQSKELKSRSKNKKRSFSNPSSWLDKFFKKYKNNKKGKPVNDKKTEVNKLQNKQPAESKDNKNETETKKKDMTCTEAKKVEEVPINDKKNLTSSPPIERNVNESDKKVRCKSSENDKPCMVNKKSSGEKKDETQKKQKKSIRDDMTKKRDDMLTKGEAENKKKKDKDQPFGKSKYCEKLKKKEKKCMTLPWPFNKIGKKKGKKRRLGSKIKETVARKNKKCSAPEKESAGKKDQKNPAGAVEKSGPSEKTMESSKNQTQIRKEKVEHIKAPGDLETKPSKNETKLGASDKTPSKNEKDPNEKQKDPCKKDKPIKTPCNVDKKCGKQKKEKKECKDKEPQKKSKPKKEKNQEKKKPKKKSKPKKEETKTVPKEKPACEVPEENCAKKKKREICTGKDCKENQMVGVSDRMKGMLLSNVLSYSVETIRFSHDGTEEVNPPANRTPFDTSCCEVSAEMEKEMAFMRKVARSNRRRVCGAANIGWTKFHMTRPPEEMDESKVNISQPRYIRRILRKSTNPDCVPIVMCPSCE